MSREIHEDLEQNLKDLYSQVPSPPTGLRQARGQMLAEAAALRAVQ